MIPKNILIFPGILLIAGLSVAQDYRGRVQSIVTDASSATIPGAQLTLLNTNTLLSQVRTTDASGRYLLDFVEPGTYSLTADSPGFGKLVKKNIQVLVRSDITIDVPLLVGGVTQTVLVSESAVQIQFDTTTLARTIDGKMLKELPVPARNPFTLALLDPAVLNRYSDVSKRVFAVAEPGCVPVHRQPHGERLQCSQPAGLREPVRDVSPGGGRQQPCRELRVTPVHQAGPVGIVLPG